MVVLLLLGDDDDELRQRQFVLKPVKKLKGSHQRWSDDIENPPDK